MSITEKVLCSKSHEFLLDNGNGTYTVGLTDYAVEQLGDIVFLELPEIEYLNNCAELYAQFLLYLPEDMEKKTMNPMHRWELREEEKQQKETRSIEARLRRNHSGY